MLIAWLKLGKPDPGPLVHEQTPKKDIVPPPIPPVVEKKEKDLKANSLAALTGRLADKTLDQAKVLWTVANPVEGMPMGDLPNVKELDPAAEDPAAHQPGVDVPVASLAPADDDADQAVIAETVPHTHRIHAILGLRHELLDFLLVIAAGGCVELIRLAG